MSDITGFTFLCKNCNEKTVVANEELVKIRNKLCLWCFNNHKQNQRFPTGKMELRRETNSKKRHTNVDKHSYSCLGCGKVTKLLVSPPNMCTCSCKAFKKNKHTISL